MVGLLHAIATVTFGVDHVVSGVAINILAAGLARFLSELFYTDNPAGGGVTQSPALKSHPPSVSLPVLSSGPDLLGRLDEEVLAAGQHQVEQSAESSNIFGVRGDLVRLAQFSGG